MAVLNGNQLYKKRCISCYLNVRGEYLRRPKTSVSNYYLALASPTENIGGCLSNITEEILFLALHDDIEVKGIGSKLLLRSYQSFSSRLPDVLRIMAKYGIWESPFNIGTAFNLILDSNLQIAVEASNQLDRADNNNLIYSILLALSERDLIPNAFDRHISKFVKVGTQETKSLALAALCKKPALAQRLEEDVWSGLLSEEWYIGGNAARVCGYAQLSPSRFITKLVGLVDDFEGHDWCPAECAVEALRQYNPQEAAIALPAIVNTKNKWLNGYEKENDNFDSVCHKTIELFLELSK